MMDALRFTLSHQPVLRQHTFQKMARNLLHVNPKTKSFIATTMSRQPKVASTGEVSPPRPIVSPDSLQYPPGYLGAVPTRSSSGLVKTIINDYFANIVSSSRVYDIAIQSPLQFAPKLSQRLGVNLWLKREDLQPTFSFKLRGAYNMMAKLPEELLEKGVICSSTGNHAQGVALSAKKLNCTAVIAMSITTPQIKQNSVKNLGATTVLVGNSYEEAMIYAKRRANDEGFTFVSGFDHPDVIAGHGTVGMEIVNQMHVPIHAIFAPVGGGGLIAGIASYVKRVSPQVKIIGVQPSDANSMALSLHHGERVILDRVDRFAEGVANTEVGEYPFPICKELIDGIVLVTRHSICASIKAMFEENRNILEPSGAVALAGAQAYCKYYGLREENVVVVTSGANMDFDKLGLVTSLANVKDDGEYEINLL